jgi:hypothetical protein
MDTVRMQPAPSGWLEPNRERWEAWESATKNQHTRPSGLLLGFLESILLFVALWSNAHLVVGAWLAFKLAAKWEAWSHIVLSNAADLPFDDKLKSLWVRHRWGVQLLRRFLIGTLWIIISAGTGVLVGKYVAFLWRG